EQAALLELVEGGVGGGGRDVAGGRQLGEVIVGKLLDRALHVAGAHRPEGERLGRDGRALGEVALALPRLEPDVALPGQVGWVPEATRIAEGDSVGRHVRLPRGGASRRLR